MKAQVSTGNTSGTVAMVSHYFCVNIPQVSCLRERLCRHTRKTDERITATLEICIYSPVVCLKEALPQKESIIIKDFQIRRIQSLIYFFEPARKRHQGCKGWLCAQGCRIDYQAERVKRSERNADYLTDNRGDADVWPWNYVQKAQSAERAEPLNVTVSLWAASEELLTRKSIFTCKITLSFLKDLMKICATAWNLPASILLLSDSTADSEPCFSLQWYFAHKHGFVYFL